MGASNRLKNLKEALNGEKYDYIVSCEGGLIELYGSWFNVHEVIVEDNTGKQARGLSQAFPIPEEYIKKAMQTSMSQVFDEVCGEGKGISRLTHGKVSRQNLVEQATMMALTRFLNGDIW